MANRSTAATTNIIRNVLEKSASSLTGSMMSSGGVMSVPVEVQEVPVPKEIEATVDPNENSNTSLEILVEEDTEDKHNTSHPSKKPKLDTSQNNLIENEVEIEVDVDVKNMQEQINISSNANSPTFLNGN